MNTHDMKIEISIPCETDAMKQAALLFDGQEQLKAVEAWVATRGGTFSVRPVRRNASKNTAVLPKVASAPDRKVA